MSEFENDLPPVLDQKSERKTPSSPVTSLPARLLNVLAMPGQVFEEVRTSGRTVWNWLLPAPVYAVSLALFTAAMFSTPAIQKLWSEQTSMMRSGQSADLAAAVKSGKTTQADADKTLAFTDSFAGPRTLRVIGLVSGFGFGLVRIFWWALVLWYLARKVLKQPVHYGKMLEVAGIASVVAMIGNLVLVALVMNVGKTASDTGSSIVVANLESSRLQTIIAIAQNGLNFWLIAVLGAGLARMTGLPWARGLFLMAAYWLASEFLLMALGVGFMR